MYTAIKEIQDAFNAANLKNRVEQLGDNWVLRASVSGKACQYDFLFIKSDDQGNDVAVRIFDLVKFPADRMDKAYEVLTELQRKYRFARFNLGKEGAVNIEYDFPVAYDAIGEGAVEILIRISRILDECYPVLMRSIWA